MNTLTEDFLKEWLTHLQSQEPKEPLTFTLIFSDEPSWQDFWNQVSEQMKPTYVSPFKEIPLDIISKVDKVISETEFPNCNFPRKTKENYRMYFPDFEGKPQFKDF